MSRNFPGLYGKNHFIIIMEDHQKQFIADKLRHLIVTTKVSQQLLRSLLDSEILSESDVTAIEQEQAKATLLYEILLTKGNAIANYGELLKALETTGQSDAVSILSSIDDEKSSTSREGLSSIIKDSYRQQSSIAPKRHHGGQGIHDGIVGEEVSPSTTKQARLETNPLVGNLINKIIPGEEDVGDEEKKLFFDKLAQLVSHSKSNGNLLREFCGRTPQSSSSSPSAFHIQYLKVTRTDEADDNNVDENLELMAEALNKLVQLVAIRLFRRSATLTLILKRDWASWEESRGTDHDEHQSTANFKFPTSIFPSCLIIFCNDAISPLKYVLQSQSSHYDDSSAQTIYVMSWNDDLLGGASLAQVGEFAKEAIRSGSGALSELAQVELKWSQLGESCRRQMLMEKFEIKDDDDKALDELVKTTKEDNIIDGEILLHLLHPRDGDPECSTKGNLLGAQLHLLNLTDWLRLQILPCSRKLRWRNNFSLYHLTDTEPILEGHIIKTVWRCGAGEGGSTQASEEDFSQIRSSKAVKLTEFPIDDAIIIPSATHTFDLIDEGSFRAVTNSRDPSSDRVEWKAIKPSTYKWVSSASPSAFTDLQKCLMRHGVADGDAKRVTTTDIQHLASFNRPHRHCVISGEPGSGKTVALKVLAKHLISENLLQKSQQDGGGLVIFAAFPDFIHSIMDMGPISKPVLIDALTSKLASYYDSSSVVRDFLKNQLLASPPSSSTQSVSLLLDGIDQVGIGNLGKCFKVLELLQKEFPTELLSMYVTCRPQLVLRLEAILNTFAYKLEPLDSSQCKNFLRLHGGWNKVVEEKKLDELITKVQTTTTGSPTPLQLELMATYYDEPETVFSALSSGKSSSDHPRGSFQMNLIETSVNNWITQTCKLTTKSSAQEQIILLGALRHRLVEMRCPELTSLKGYFECLLGAPTEKVEIICKGDILTQFPTAKLLCSTTAVAETVIAGLLHRLWKSIITGNNNTGTDDDDDTRKETIKMQLWNTFFKSYYVFNVDGLCVTRLESGYNNEDLLSKLCFKNIFDMLDELLQSEHEIDNTKQQPTSTIRMVPPLSEDEDLSNVLGVAAFHGHRSIFNLFSTANKYCYNSKLHANPKCIELLLANRNCNEHFSRQILTFPEANVDLVLESAVRLLKVQSCCSGNAFWSLENSFSAHGLFEQHKETNINIVTFMNIITSIFSNDQGFEIKRKSELAAEIFRMLVTSKFTQIGTKETQDFLKFLLKINPNAAQGTFRRDCLSTLRLLLQVNVNPANFRHQNRFFQDIVQLVAKLRDTNFENLGTTKEKDEIVKYAEDLLEETCNLDQSKWISECQQWYAKLYSMVVDMIYSNWLEKYDDWRISDEFFSKTNFLRSIASHALELKFPGKKKILEVCYSPDDDDSSSSSSSDSEKDCRKGIILKRKSLASKAEDALVEYLSFHDTLGHYLIAWLIANVEYYVRVRSFKSFMINDVMANRTVVPKDAPLLAAEAEEYNNELQPPHPDPMASIEKTVDDCRYANFFIWYFLDKHLSWVEEESNLGSVMRRGGVIKEEASQEIIKTVILPTCDNLKLSNLHGFFVDLCRPPSPGDTRVGHNLTESNLKQGSSSSSGTSDLETGAGDATVDD